MDNYLTLIGFILDSQCMAAGLHAAKIKENKV